MPLAAAPRDEPPEVEPLTVDEARRVLAVAEGRRNGAAWTIALSLGLRRGEVLGLAWDDVDLGAGTLRVRQALQRHPQRHGCGERPCGKRPADCPAMIPTALVLGAPKSAAGTRAMALPAPLVSLLRAHRRAQRQERLAAGSRWQDTGLVFARPDGRPVEPSLHWREWRALLAEAGVRPARLHDARHTAASLLLAQGVDARVAMDILGWASAAVARRYEHVLPELRRDAAERMTAALWAPTATTTATTGPPRR